MALTNSQLQAQLELAQLKLNQVQTSLNNTATRRELKNLVAVIESQITSLQDVVGTVDATGSLYPPRVTTTERDALNPAQGAIVYNTTTDALNLYTGSSWVLASTDVEDIDHGTLGGLSDDDHTQYILADGTRDFSAAVGGVTPVVSGDLATKGYIDDEIAGFSTDHGDLTGLSDDDHPQYGAIADTEAISALWTFSTHPSGLDHSELLNRDSDDHDHYFLIDGTRAMSGALKLTNGSKITDSADGIIEITNNAEDEGIRLDTQSGNKRLTVTTASGIGVNIYAANGFFGNGFSFASTSLVFGGNGGTITHSTAGMPVQLVSRTSTDDTTSGFASLRTGNNTASGNYGTGDVSIYTGSTTTDGNTGDIKISTGAAGAGAADAGDIIFAVNGAFGNGTTLLTLDASAGTLVAGGDINLNTNSKQLVVDAGTVSDPSIVFGDDDDGSGTGIYREDTDALGLVAGGVSVVKVYNQYVNVTRALYGSAIHTTDNGKTSFGNAYSTPDAWLSWSNTGTHHLEFALTNGDGSGNDKVVWYANQGEKHFYIGEIAQSVKLDTSVDSVLTLTDESGGNLEIISQTFGATTFRQKGNAAFSVTNNAYAQSLSINTSAGSGAYASGAITINTGDTVNAGDYDSGALSLYTGDTTTDGDSGDVNIYTGVAGAGIADAGDIIFAVNGAPGAGTTMMTMDASAGKILVGNNTEITGTLDVNNNITCSSGIFNIVNNSQGVGLNVKTINTSNAANGGGVSMYSGDNTNAGDYDSGALSIYTGTTNTDGDTGNVEIYTGAAGAGNGDAGDINFATHGSANVHLQITGAGAIMVPTIPTSDPSVAGQLWADSTDGYTLKVSQG